MYTQPHYRQVQRLWSSFHDRVPRNVVILGSGVYCSTEVHLYCPVNTSISPSWEYDAQQADSQMRSGI